MARQKLPLDTTTWKIPTEDPLSSIMDKALTLRKEIDTEETLVIVYYGGHAFMNEDRQQMWARTNRTNEGQLEWYAVQPLFMRAKSDVLFLLDCCSAASAATKVRDVVGTKKTIAACGFESKAAEPGAHSFTSELIDILTKWQNIPFSVAMLSSELLSNLKHHKPKPDMFNKVVESRSSPTHYFTTVNPRTPSIILRRHIRKQEIVEKCKSRKRRKVSFDSSPEEASSLSESSIPACAATVSDSSSEGFSSSEDIERKFFKYSRENHFSRGYISVNVIQAIDSSVFL